MNVGSKLQTCKKFLYNGPIRSAVRWAGLEMSLARVYASLLRRIGEDSITYTACDVSASFYRSAYLPDDMPERTVVEDLLTNLRPDDVFYDLGANRGIYTCLGGQVLSGGCVVAFEADPRTVKQLRANVALNDLESRVTICQRAVAAESERTAFFANSGSTGSSLIKSSEDGHAERIEVDAVALRPFRVDRGLPAPDVLKIDIEGAEFDALRGMSITAENDVPRLIYCEVHRDALANFGAEPDDVVDRLEELGFTVRTSLFERSDDHYILRATR
jgi:FkbM family methyltransferase